MKLERYLKDKLPVVLLGAVVAGLQMMFLTAVGAPADLATLIGGLSAGLVVAALVWDFCRKRGFYNEFLRNLGRLDRKYLVLEMMEKPSFYEGKLLFEALYDIHKSMSENVNAYAGSVNDFKEYVEMWVHEVKIPIASLQLMCHNDGQDAAKKYLEQIARVDNYTDQVLYYVRSENAENDYLIREISLEKVIRKTAVKHKNDLLSNGIDLLVEGVQRTVFSDEKWLEFILGQIISNAVKYRCESRQSHISIWAEETKEQVELHVRDNGIGIPAADLPRVFKKSFTGENGRKGAKSTGMGLYITKKLCARLGHRVEITSREGEYTEVILTFAKNEYFDPIYGAPKNDAVQITKL